jgi:hypothetical protein
VQISTELSTYGRNILDSKVQNQINTEKNGLVRSNELDKVITSSEATGLSSSESLISKRERNFFKKMFPDSAPVIDNYVLFNSSGRLTNPEINKGTYVDAWA